jgi:hypothetical protein
MRWADDVTRMGEMRDAYILVGKPEGKSHSEDPGVEGRMILEWTLEE